MTYSGKDYGESVYLNFKKQYDGTFILSYASGRFPQDKVEVDKSYKSDWTKEQFDALNKGDYTDPSNGTKLEDVVKDHPKASSAEYTISTSRQGEFTKEMTISYSDYKAEDGKLKSVYLSFDTKEGEDTFLPYLLNQVQMRIKLRDRRGKPSCFFLDRRRKLFKFLNYTFEQSQSLVTKETVDKLNQKGSWKRFIGLFITSIVIYFFSIAMSFVVL